MTSATHKQEQDQNAPPNITGGCLCNQTRYTISFPHGSTWPPESHTCQCTQCRKATGALIAPFLTLHPSQITWTPPTSSPTSAFKRYSSTKGVYRGFCAECGSALTWESDSDKDEVEVLVGSVDERFLVGVEVSDGDEGEGTEMRRRREGGVGRELALPMEGNFWCRNQIVGVTDRVVGGRKFVEGSKLAEFMD